MEVKVKKRMEQAMIAYHYEGDSVIIVSAFVLEKGRKEKHIGSGRWERLDEEEI